MPIRTFRLKIVKEGQEFEAEGDKAFVLEMLKRFGPQVSAVVVEHETQRSPRRGESVTRPSVGKSVSIREFIQQLDFKKHTDISLAFGYYLEKQQGAAEFTSTDIINCYYDAKLEPSNTSQMIIQNIKRGYLMPSKKKDGKGKNRYTLTASGEKFVEAKLPSSS